MPSGRCASAARPNLRVSTCRSSGWKPIPRAVSRSVSRRGMENTMTLLKAIVRPNKVEAVKEALGRIGVAGMTVTEVRGHGKQKGHTAIYRGKEYAVDLLPKMQ